jgi:hypothetical protein
MLNNPGGNGSGSEGLASGWGCWCGALLAVLAALVVLGAACWFVIRTWPGLGGTNFSKLPPEAAFGVVIPDRPYSGAIDDGPFREAIDLGTIGRDRGIHGAARVYPSFPGVTEVCASGYALGIYGDINIRVRARVTDEVIAFLVRKSKRLPDVAGPMIQASLPFLTDALGREAGLDEAVNATTLEVYQKRSGWGRFCVDRRRHLLFGVLIEPP